MNILYDNKQKKEDSSYIYQCNLNQEINNTDLSLLLSTLSFQNISTKRIAIISDFEVYKSNAIDTMHLFAQYINADVYNSISLNSICTRICC